MKKNYKIKYEIKIEANPEGYKREDAGELTGWRKDAARAFTDAMRDLFRQERR